MNKKRLFSVVSSGILAFSAGAPSVLAGTPFVLELLQDAGEEDYKQEAALSDIVEIENEETAGFLSEVYVSRDKDGNIILSGNSSTYNIELTLSEEEISVEEDEAFQVTIELSTELKDDQLSVRIMSDTEVVEEVVIAVKELAQLADGSSTYRETDKENSEESPSQVEESAEDSDEEELAEIELDVSEIEQEEIINETEVVTDEESEEDEDATTEENSIDSSSENINEAKSEDAESADSEEMNDVDPAGPVEDEESDSNKDQDEEPVSFERSGEVEALLHGEEESAPVFRTFSTMMFTSSVRTHNDGLYAVRSGDTFNAIASSFNLTVPQLSEWNKHVTNINALTVGTQLAVTRRGVERLLSDSDKARLYTGGAKPVFSTNQGFIDEIAPRAVAIANQEGQEALWPSLMIAQAAHESAYGRSSLSAPPYHNLSGIKGNYNGNSILMWTWEVYNGNRVDVLAGFRQYPSYTESLQDYANLLRRGLSWDRRYYSGTWRSTTNSVWDVLDNGGLRGYATDPRYFTAIRNLINQYNLTQYDDIASKPAPAPTPEPEPEPVLDPHPVMFVTNSKETSFSAFLRTGFSIDTHPWGTKGFQRLGRTANYAGQTVRVVREAQHGAYYLIELNGELLGWVDNRSIDITARKVSNAVNTTYDVIVQDGWYSIDSLPWGTKGYFRIGNSTQYRGEKVTVVQETANGNYKLIEKNGELIGWVDHRSVARAIQVGNTANSFPVDYTATIANSGFSIDSLPWGTEGYQRIGRSDSYIGTRVQVTHESGAYARVSINGTPLGWVDKKALNDVPVRQNYSVATSVNYTATLDAGYTIDTLPWGVSGHRRISRTRFYSGETVRVLSQTGSYALIQIRGRNIGWVDRRALVR